jgi:hypothetical protein
LIIQLVKSVPFFPPKWKLKEQKWQMLFDKGIRKDCDVEMLKVTCEDGRYFVHESLDILDAYASTVILHPLDYMLHLDTKGHKCT